MYEKNNAYRRGVILGLTLAEIMLLILFLLLLTFASVLSSEKEKYEKKLQLVSKNTTNIEKIVYVLDKRVMIESCV
jgi:peptidoglycan hydrolase CwlO-like protein